MAPRRRGLNRQRQQQLLDVIFPVLQNQTEPEPEMVYLAGALEQLSPETKRDLVHIFSKRLLKKPQTYPTVHLGTGTSFKPNPSIRWA